MTGIPQFNFPAFFEAAADLRERGYDVVSPAELDEPETRAAALASPDGAPGSGAANGETWADFLSRDVKLIGDEIEAIAVLPGWHKSRGARLETFVARLCDLPVHRYDGDEPSGLLAMTDDELNQILGYGNPGVPSQDGAWQAGEAVSADEDCPHCRCGEVPCICFQRCSGPHTPPAVDEERVVNATTGGQKGRKAQRMELLPYGPLMKVAELYAAGAKKYEPHNWRRGFDWSLSFGAMQRHAALYWEGEDFDEETACHHLSSVVFHALTLLHFADEFPEFDDRPNTALERAA